MSFLFSNDLSFRSRSRTNYKAHGDLIQHQHTSFFFLLQLRQREIDNIRETDMDFTTTNFTALSSNLLPLVIYINSSRHYLNQPEDTAATTNLHGGRKKKVILLSLLAVTLIIASAVSAMLLLRNGSGSTESQREMDVERSLLCNCVVNFLLEERYLLTAFELLHELLDDGREPVNFLLFFFFSEFSFNSEFI